MKAVEPILVSHLFPKTLDALLDLLRGLSAEDWNKPTVCSGWSVKDIASHLLSGELGILSRKRDSHSGGDIKTCEELVALINNLNDTWVKATRRLSPQVLCDLLRFTGLQVCDYFSSLDPFAMGGPVDWVDARPAPVWLDLAREYTERWHHQQQIRDAVGRPGFKQPEFFAPILDAFVRALPRTYEKVEAPHGTFVALRISGDSGGRWVLSRESHAWQLYVDDNQPAAAELIIDQDDAWRLFTKGITVDQARTKAGVIGDQPLALKALETISVLA